MEAQNQSTDGIQHTHDPKNASASIQNLLSKVREHLDDECPECGREIWRIQGSVGSCLSDGEVFVRHYSGASCTVAVDVDWHSEMGSFAQSNAESGGKSDAQ